ncbi:MAG: hypothetical protein A3J38_05995 [Gammaproteobacteria bacterium RIFCSPHIGHO2_12_FULL_45_9]|nr:MAG: hypothetical protein A3J38_05995 [Gammaproteobacteria bacterium RIFCSPHIGHO2_12_FULL_45_9]
MNIVRYLRRWFSRLTRPTRIALATASGVVLVCAAIILWPSVERRVAAMPPIPTVSAMTVHTETWQPTFKTTGTLAAFKSATLKAEVAGKIQSLTFEPGQTVTAGSVLITLENTNQRGALEYAQAQANLSRATFERDTRLLQSSRGALSQDDYDTARYTYQSNLGKLQQAEADYNDTIIKAPFDGVLGLTTLSVGQYVAAGDTLVQIQQLDPLYVEFSVPESYVSHIHRGQQVIIKSNEPHAKSLTGALFTWDAAVNTTTGALTLRATVPNGHHTLLPGNFVSVKWFLDHPETVVTVPALAINYDTNGNYVYRVEKGRAIRVLVTLGPQLKQDIIVTEGLKPGDVVISAGTNKVQDGMKVRVVMEK